MVSFKKFCVISGLVVSIAGLSACSENSDSPEQRKQAARQYLQVTSVNTIVEAGIFEFASSVPAEQRALLVEKIRTNISKDVIEEIAVEALAKVFTTNELDALTEFYGSEVGKTAVNKFGAYSAEVMPHIRKQIQHAAAPAAGKSK